MASFILNKVKDVSLLYIMAFLWLQVLIQLGLLAISSFLLVKTQKTLPFL